MKNHTPSDLRAKRRVLKRAATGAECDKCGSTEITQLGIEDPEGPEEADEDFVANWQRHHASYGGEMPPAVYCVNCRPTLSREVVE